MRCGRKRGLTREGKKNVGFEADDGSILVVKKKGFLFFFLFLGWPLSILCDSK